MLCTGLRGESWGTFLLSLALLSYEAPYVYSRAFSRFCCGQGGCGIGDLWLQRVPIVCRKQERGEGRLEQF